MSVWVIIGASKGLGAALVQRILQQDSSTVFACSRNPKESDELLQLASLNKTRLHLVQLDVTEETSVKVSSCSESKTCINGCNFMAMLGLGRIAEGVS